MEELVKWLKENGVYTAFKEAYNLEANKERRASFHIDFGIRYALNAPISWPVSTHVLRESTNKFDEWYKVSNAWVRHCDYNKIAGRYTYEVLERILFADHDSIALKFAKELRWKNLLDG